MERFIHLLHHDQEELAKQLPQDEDLLHYLMETLQDNTDDSTKVIDFLKSNYCTAEVAVNILSHLAVLIVGGINEPIPTMFDVLLMAKVAYTFGVIEICCFDKIYK